MRFNIQSGDSLVAEPMVPPNGGGSIPTSSLQNKKAWQRQIRDKKQEQNPKANYTSLDNAIVKEISFETAKTIILEYEWLGNMGTTEYAFGLFMEKDLAGVVCFGRTGGTNVTKSVAGEEYAKNAITLCRGACVHYAHPHSASFLISHACHLMTKKGYYIFIAYSDTDAGEIGTVYQASNWLYCGKTNSTEKFRTPDGKEKDARLVSAYCRDRRNRIPNTPMKYKCTRKEMKEKMLAEGCVFFKGKPKHRYIGLYGPKNIISIIRTQIKWPILPYPKRESVAF